MKTLTLTFALTFSLLIFTNTYSQIIECTPDPTCEENIPGNGMVCPEELSPTFVGEYYDKTLTIIPPSSFEQWQGVITAIRIDDVQGLPDGVEWGKSQAVFNTTDPITRYCAKLYGTPTVPGEYQLRLYVTPYIGGVPMNNFQQVDDTSYVLVVETPTLAKLKEIEKVNIFPNPASDNFTVEAIGLEYVTVTDLLGKELISIRANSDRLNINISKLNKSYYFIRVRTNKGEFVRKLMKY